MAHPDDGELWAGGVLAQAADADVAHLVVSTRDPARAREAEEGAAVLGAHLHLLEGYDGDELHGLLERIRPDVLITHRFDDVHSDHRATCEAVLRALPDVVIATGRPKRAYMCDTYNSLTLVGRVSGTVVVDVSDHFDRKINALRVHRSQPVDHFIAMAERLATSWGATRGCRWGEAFDPVPLLGQLPVADSL